MSEELKAKQEIKERVLKGLDLRIFHNFDKRILTNDEMNYLDFEISKAINSTIQETAQDIFGEIELRFSCEPYNWKRLQEIKKEFLGSEKEDKE